MGMDLSQEIVLTDSLEQLEQGLVTAAKRPEFPEPSGVPGHGNHQATE